MGNPILVILNIHDDITTRNIEQILIAQKSGLEISNEDINSKYIYITKTH